MPRPRLRRRLRFFPQTDYFKPIGKPLRLLEEITLTQEELEALKLINLEELDQTKAAKKMSISQPTFNRTLKQARKKITQALTQGKAIKIVKQK
jgi:predicted DNA-binding protein (UPF0251 family)